MNARDDEIRRVVAELDVRIAEVEASVAVLKALPAKRTRRLLLLDWVAQAFEPGRKYPESVVDEILKSVFDDHCTLRRYLVDESFMSRNSAGVYWRAGGTVDA